VPSILNILQHTPWWVFALFGLLVWLGIQALRPRTLPIWRLLITPAVFIGWGLTSLALRSTSSPVLIADWLLAAAVCAAIAWTTSRLHDVGIDRAQQLVSLPGSAWPLFRNLLNFFVLYGLGVASAIAPTSKADLAVWYIAVSGASAGYFVGWSARFASRYRQTTGQIPVAGVQS
jgi:hypothetical protein